MTWWHNPLPEAKFTFMPIIIPNNIPQSIVCANHTFIKFVFVFVKCIFVKFPSVRCPSIIWRTSRALWPSDNIQQHSTWSTLAQAMVCCPTAPSHYLNQCCLLISAILRHSPKINFAASVRATILYNAFENHTFKSATTSPKSQWFKVPLRGEWPKWYHEFLRHP